MDDDRSKWDSRYGGKGFFLGPDPSAFLVERIDLIESLCPGRRALDIACGEGRNSIFLAGRGFSVTGIDISAEGIAKASKWAGTERLAVEYVTADLEDYEFTRSWDLIINFNFLLRELLPRAVAALNPGGVMVVDTILDTPSQPGEHTRAFLLQPGELTRLFAGFPGKILIHEEHPLDSAPTAKLIFKNNSG
jgi:tellurite methyltransferase